MENRAGIEEEGWVKAIVDRIVFGERQREDNNICDVCGQELRKINDDCIGFVERFKMVGDQTLFVGRYCGLECSRKGKGG